MSEACCHALRIARQFCEADFMNRDAQAAAALCAENVIWFGMGVNADMQGIGEARRCLEREIAENPGPYQVEYLSEREGPAGAADSAAMLRLRIANADLALECRLSVTTVWERGVPKIGTLHMSAPAPLRRYASQEDKLRPVEGPADPVPYGLREQDGSCLCAQEPDRMPTKSAARGDNNIPGAVFRCRFDRDWTILSANDGLFAFLGYTREEFARMGNGMSAVIHPEDMAVMAARISTQPETGKATAENQSRLTCKDGKVKWVSMSAQMLCERGEKTVSCIFVDITKQKQVEEKLRESKKNLAISMEQAGVYYWEVDCRSKTVYFSKPIQELFPVPELSENFPYGFVSQGFVAPAHRQRYIDSINAILAGAPYVVFEAQINSVHDGYSWYRIRLTGIKGEDGSAERAICTAEPIAEYMDLENRFTTILKQNSIGTWIYDIKQHMLPKQDGLNILPDVTNGEIENVPESLIEKKIVHPDDADKMRAFYRGLDEGELQVSATLRVRQGTSTQYRWNRCAYTVIPDKQGHPTYAIGSAVDVTDQMEAKQKYEEALQIRYRKLEENVLLAGHCNITQNRIEEVVDQTGLNLLDRFGSQREAFFTGLGGLIPDDAQRKQFYDIYLRDGVERNYNLGITQHSLNCEIALDPSSSALCWALINIDVAKSPGSNDLIGFLTVEDMTENKMQAQVLDAAIRFDYDYIARLNLNAAVMVMYQSKGVGAQLGGYEYGVSYPYEESVGRTTRQYIIDEDKTLYQTNMSIVNLRRRLETHDIYEFTYRMKEYTGEIRTKRARFVAYDRAGKIVVFSRVDITNLVQEEVAQKRALAESLAIAQNANKSKSEFLSTMSHDIRTPMNAIIGMCDLALADQSDPAQVNESLQVIKSSSNLLLSLINDILDMSRIESGKMTLAEEGFSVAEQVQIAGKRIKPLAEKKNIDLKLFSGVTHDQCIGDVVRIHRVVGNLLSNAVKFTPDGGTITCRLSETERTNKNIGLYRLEVSDTGIGMTAAEQAHAFDAFYRATNAWVSGTEGTGLGLPIVKSIVDYMGGTISMHSAPGAGTTVIIELPLRLAQNSQLHGEGPRAPGLQAGALAGVHVLMCEDHLVNQRVAAKILEKAGVTVTVAENGQRGYELFQASRNNTYQAILMDLQMPVMNGYEAARAIRECGHPQAKAIPILAMTANAFAEDVQKCLEAGMNDHLAKPIEPQRLYETLRRYVGDRSLRQPEKRKVLFVDGAKLDIAALTAAIPDAFEVLVAHSGEEALRTLEKTPEVVALVTDIVMPGMDGLTLIRTLRADSRFRNLAILANTRYSDPAQEKLLLNIGVDDFLCEPITPQLVQSRLCSCLRKYGRY